MRRMSPCTRIMGGRPEDRCRSEALFLTTKASSSEMSIYNYSGLRCGARPSVAAAREGGATASGIHAGCGRHQARGHAHAHPRANALGIMATIQNNLQAVKIRIAAACKASGRPDSAVQLVAVSKTHPAQAVRTA